MKRLITICCLTFAILANAQTSSLGTWNVINAKLNVDARWSVFAETQTRSQHFFNDFYYYELKGALAIQLTKTFRSSWAGAVCHLFQ